MDRKRMKPDKDMDEEDKMDPEYLHSRCVTCRRRILDGEKVICPFNRCNVCQGGICEDCVYKGTGDLRWMCGCCHRKRKERARTSSAQPDNWFFDLNETFDSLNAPTRSRETCSTETTESHLNDSGANKCPSEGMESQRAYATNDHANQISESSQSSSSSNAARESMKKAIKPSEYHLEVVHLSGSPSQRRHMTNKPTNCDKSVTHSDYKNPQSKKDYPAQDKSQSHHEKVDSPKNKTDNVHQPRKVDTGAKNKREKNESGKETETFIEYFRYHFLSSNYRKDKAQSNNSHPHPNLKETQISNNEIQGNNKPSIPKNKEKVPPLYSDSLRVDLPPPYFSDLSYKRVEQEHQARNKDTSISPEHQRPPPEYYQDTPNMKQRLEKHDLRGRPLERGRQIKGAPERNSSLECHTERRDSHRQHVSRIDTIPHGSKKLPSDGWDNGTVAERKSRSTSLGRPQMNLPQERERGYSVDEMRYGERNVGKRQPRLERQNTSMDYYWEQPHQRKDHHAPLRPNLDDDNEFEKALCSFRNFDYDFEPESFSELDICAQNPRRYMYDEDRHYSDRASGVSLIPSSALPRVHAQQNEALAVDFGARRSSSQPKDRRSPKSYSNDSSPYHSYPMAHNESNTWRDRSARSLDIPNRSPEIRRASLNETVKPREPLNYQDEDMKEAGEPVRMNPHSYEDKYGEYNCYGSSKNVRPSTDTIDTSLPFYQDLEKLSRFTKGP